MKRLNEMNYVELAAMTSDEVDTLIKLEAAHEGIQIPGQPPAEPEIKSLVKKTVTVWSVDGVSVHFGTKASADRVASLLAELSDQGDTFTSDYDYATGYEYKHAVKSEICPKASEVKYYSKSDLHLHQAVLNAQKAAKETYDKVSTEYKNQSKAFEGIRGDVWNAVCAARDQRAREERLSQVFDEYLELAGGDKSVALGFFDKAHPGLSEHSRWIATGVKGDAIEPETATG
jgi:hypothetical protein